MSNLLYKLLFGPVLLAQAWWVRKKTPVLPAPQTVEKGVVGAGSALRLLLLGDSSAAGVGAELAEQTLLGQMLQNLSQNYTVTYQMMAASGRTTAAMITELKSQPPKKFDVIVTALGVNDVTAQVSPQKWLAQQKALLKLIKKHTHARLIIFSGLPPVGDFPALPWPLNRFLGGQADVFDDLLRDLCATKKGVIFHSMRNYPSTASCAIDGFHPGPNTYEVWAKRLTETIRQLH